MGPGWLRIPPAYVSLMGGSDHLHAARAGAAGGSAALIPSGPQNALGRPFVESNPGPREDLPKGGLQPLWNPGPQLLHSCLEEVQEELGPTRNPKPSVVPPLFGPSKNKRTPGCGSNIGFGQPYNKKNGGLLWLHFGLVFPRGPAGLRRPTKGPKAQTTNITNHHQPPRTASSGSRLERSERLAPRSRGSSCGLGTGRCSTGWRSWR